MKDYVAEYNLIIMDLDQLNNNLRCGMVRQL